MTDHQATSTARPEILKRIFLEFARMRLAVWILIAMFIVMVVGSIFPQGYDAEMYISSWGKAKYEGFARWGLLNLFHTPLFYGLGALLLLNLTVCSIVRWLGRRGTGPGVTTPPGHAREITIHGQDPEERAIRTLTLRGYRIMASGGGLVTARKGPWPEGVSLLYHLAMGLAIVGFVISALYAFEGDVTLYPGEPVDVPTVSADTRAARLFGAPSDTTRHITLTLEEFITEWELHQEKYYPKDWMSDLTIRNEDGEEHEFLVEVNRPLRIAGLTFYQMAYEQTFDVIVLVDSMEVERVSAESYAPFTLKTVGGTFFPSTLRVGTLFQRGTEPRPIIAHIPLKWQAPQAADGDTTNVPPPSMHGGGDRIELGDLSVEEPLQVGDVRLIMENPYEGSILTYRHDPGVPLLYIAITAFMVGLVVRTYWPSYRVSLWIEGSRGWLVFRATGILGEPEDIEDALVQEISAGPTSASRAAR
jgi:cytochrome c biogenesis protein ResB